MSFSPDGRFLLYDLPAKESLDRDIFVLSVHDGTETPLISHKGADLFPIWTPNGKLLLFFSDRGGNLGLWSVPIEGRRIAGKPELIKSNIGRVYPMGLTASGSLYYGAQAGSADIYELRLDEEGTKVVSQPFRVTDRHLGSNSFPEWQPDGKALCYISMRGPTAVEFGARVLVIRLEDGSEREVGPKLSLFSDPHWAPDGKKIFVRGRDQAEGKGIYRVDAQSGEAEQIALLAPPQAVSGLALSPNGEIVYFTRADSAAKRTEIVARSVKTGEERVLHRVEHPDEIAAGIALSPDGELLVFRPWDRSGGSIRLTVVATSSGESRDLYAVEVPEQLGMRWINGALLWTADSKHVIFGRRKGKGTEDWTELWRIPRAGGEPVNLGVAMERIRDLRLHPDGQRVLFGAGWPVNEVWVLENFLPSSAAASGTSK